MFKVLDLAGFLLFAPTMIMFLLALEWGGTTYPWRNSKIIGLFCGAAGNFALFLAWEYKKGDEAMIPLGMIKRKIVYCATIVYFFFSATLMLTSYYLPIYFQAVRGATPTSSGVDVLPGILTNLFFAVISGVLGMSSLTPDHSQELTRFSLSTRLLFTFHDIRHLC